MLDHLEGVVLAVNDADAASKTFEAIFDTKNTWTQPLSMLGADVTFLACGKDVIALAQPNGPGPIRDHIEGKGEGIVGVAFSAPDNDAIAEQIRSKGVEVTAENNMHLLDPAKTHGLLTMLFPHYDREQQGLISFLYEVTHLVEDWKSVSDFWTNLFGLEGARFSPIESKQYGYEGTLTLFDPPAKLDRIEVVYPHDETKAMGKFFRKRGAGPYMCFAECDRMSELRERLRAAGARHAPEDQPEQPNSLFVHPSATHGTLIGVSPKNLAWVWSGRPELARAQT